MFTGIKIYLSLGMAFTIAMTFSPRACAALPRDTVVVALAWIFLIATWPVAAGYWVAGAVQGLCDGGRRGRR